MCPPSGQGVVPAPPGAFRADLGRFRKCLWGRKKKQDKGKASSATPLPVTFARSAGSFRSFRGRWKWGQNQRENRVLRSLSPDAYSHKEKTGVKPRKGDHDEQKRKISSLPVTGKKATLERRYTEDGSRSITAFWQAVEQEMVAYVLADECQFNGEDLRRRRAESVRNVRKPNGCISLEQHVRGAWEDDE